MKKEKRPSRDQIGRSLFVLYNYLTPGIVASLVSYGTEEAEALWVTWPEFGDAREA